MDMLQRLHKKSSRDDAAQTYFIGLVQHIILVETYNYYKTKICRKQNAFRMCGAAQRANNNNCSTLNKRSDDRHDAAIIN